MEEADVDIWQLGRTLTNRCVDMDWRSSISGTGNRTFYHFFWDPFLCVDNFFSSKRSAFHFATISNYFCPKRWKISEQRVNSKNFGYFSTVCFGHLGEMFGQFFYGQFTLPMFVCVNVFVNNIISYAAFIINQAVRKEASFRPEIIITLTLFLQLSSGDLANPASSFIPPPLSGVRNWVH